MVTNTRGPGGSPYLNTDAEWTWMEHHAGKAARWLRYISFDQIVDHRNAPPVVRIFQPPEPEGFITVGVEVHVPTADDLTPEVNVDDFRGTQPFKLVLFGEKSSLEDVIGSVADDHHADLYLPTGEISDTLLYQMARIGAEDGRPMVVFTFADCDPAGWQMPVSIARKLQAFKALEFEQLDFEVRRVALCPEHVREYGLPSTPLKDTERRADRWREAMGVEQTEIDALAALRPELLEQLARGAIAPYFDATLDRRVAEARGSWLANAQVVLDELISPDHVERIRAAGDRLSELRAELDAIDNALRLDVDELDLPEIVVPEAELGPTPDRLPLLDSRWPFAEQCLRLKASKAYEDGR